MRFERNGRSHFPSRPKTFARWHWASPTKSPRKWAGRFENGGGLLPGRPLGQANEYLGKAAEEEARGLAMKKGTARPVT